MFGRKTFQIICFATASFAAAESLLYLPIAGDMGKAEDMATVNQLYRDRVEGQFKGTLLPSPTPLAEPCGARDCAIKEGQKGQADWVIYSTVSRLGTKWVFSSTIVRSDGSGAFNQRLTALSIEDMEAVTQRMADALLSRKSAEQVATFDNITEKEETKTPERRRSLYSTGVRVGYLYPSSDSNFSYVQEHHTCEYYCYYGEYDSVSYSTQTFPQIIRLAWMNNWQFRNNLLLNTDIVWGIGLPYTDIGMDANLDYLFNPSALFPFDYAPFLGGGLGLHWVHPDEGTGLGSAKRNSGATLTAQGGLLLFRTYDVNVLLRGYYQVVLNSDVDKGAGFDVGITYRRTRDAPVKKSGAGKGESEVNYGLAGPVSNGCAAAIVLVLAIGYVALIAASSSN